ncbi:MULTISPECIES: hypothetical protein [Psychrobacter]|uniref:hypothetical protein n=1 Tax=Psychrobacter sp. TaxID=56811 RepID=UPI001D02B3D5|nr:MULTISPECIES: hypothetical protein [Psychrobacter]
MTISMFSDWHKVFGSKLQSRQQLDLRTAELWTIALQQLKTTPKEFKAAMAKSITLEWPPTAPADFLKLGRTDTAGSYPDMRQEYLAAANGDYKHEVTLETANRVGTWELKTQPESVSYKSWQKHYPEVCKEHSQGKSFKVPESHQVEYSHTALQPDSPMSAKVDGFLNQFKHKHGDAV